MGTDGAVDIGAVQFRPPLISSKAYTTTEDTPLIVPAASGLVTGASDPNGRLPLTASVAVGPAQGGVSLQPDGSFTYTPGPDFNGADGFDFAVTNSLGFPSVARASITVGARGGRMGCRRTGATHLGCD